MTADELAAKADEADALATIVSFIPHKALLREQAVRYRQQAARIASQTAQSIRDAEPSQAMAKA